MDNVMTLSGRRFDTASFWQQLDRTSSFDEAFGLYDRQVQKMGFDGSLYAYIPQNHKETRIPIPSTYHTSPSYNPDFMQHYVEANFIEHDFVAEYVISGGTRRIDWWEEVRKGRLTPANKEILIVGKEDYGIQKGLTIPLPGAAGYFASTSVISSERYSQYRSLLDKHVIDLQICSEIFHMHIIRHVAIKQELIRPLLDSLTTKEKQMLHFIVTGKPMKTLPDYCPNITEKYGDRVLHSLRGKFGGLNKSQLIYFIGLLNLLEHT